MQASSRPNSGCGQIRLALVLTLVILAPVYLSMAPSPELRATEPMSANDDIELKLYTLYISSQNTSAGGDGYITTEVPDSGGQDSSNALDNEVEFRSSDMLSSLIVHGRSQHGSSGSYYIPLDLFLRATGPSGSTVEWSITFKAGGSQVGTASWDTDACTTSFSNSCSFDHEEFEIDLGEDQSFTVSKDERFEITVSAEMSGCDGGSFPGGSSCEAEVAWNEIDDENNRFSQLEVEANALSNSLVVLQREGAELAEGPELDWYPNDILSERSMQFTFDVKSAFGRYDIEATRLIMRDSDGIYRIDHIINEDDEDIEDTSQGIFGEYLWTYPSGLPAGEYSVELEITDVQGNAFLIEHEPVEMHQWGVSINHRLNKLTEYIAPGETTAIPLQLVHKGDSTKSMEIELEVLTNLGSSWVLEFDSPGGYTLNAGGDILNPILTLTAPDDLTGTPEGIEIRAVAEAEVDSVLQVVDQDILQLDLEKIDVYQPPEVSIWNEEHDVQMANSTRPDDFDQTVPRYAEYEEFTPFLLEIFNTGFDADTFRVDVLQRAKSIIQIYDNDTGERILEDEGDGTFHTALLERHSTQVLLFNVKPSTDRDDPDIGEIEVEVISNGNSSLRTTVIFTIQRTFGINAEVSQDCDGSPLGHIQVSLCSPSSGNAVVDLRVRITNSMTSGESASWWRIQNPASLEENTDRDPAYGQWQFMILDEDGDAVPRVSLGPGDFTEVFVTVTLTSQVIAGNHTVYLRIIEDIDDDEPRYFDLPIVFEIKAGDPELQIVQVSPNYELLPGEAYSIQLKVKNNGNGPLTILLDAEVEVSGWSVDIEGPSGSPLIELEAFEEATFNLEVIVPESANNGQQVPIQITATPFDTEQSWPEEYTATTTVIMTVGISSLLDILVNEITHPRLSTLVIGLVSILLLFAGVQSRMNRRRWIAHLAYLESLGGGDEDEEIEDEDSDLPSPVTSIEEEDSDDYEDDEIELV
uniref:Alpha-galactosidase NEW3 domain-containing protein n=1 Tax=uncultured marine group II/III euryarchaeote SAT1000_15_D12 TaxID=1456560 RepID=A0A075I5W8_9EURY|nr:hypothetical protein [uncultured marine group II/III euryarchaeote SAT1000_15_D12]